MKHPNWFATLLLLPAMMLPAMAFAGEKVDKSLDFIDDGSIDISNMSGQVKVVPWDNKSVKVTGELGDNTKSFTFDRNGSRIRVKVEINNDSHWFSKDSHGDDLVINVPRKSNVSYGGVNSSFTTGDLIGELTVSTVNGSVDIGSNQGRLKATTVNGKVSADHITGNLEMQSVNGSVTVKNSTAANSSFSTTNGKLDINCSCEAVKINTVSGGVNVDVGSIKELSFSGVSGGSHIRLGLKKGANINATSVNGSVTLNFADDPSAYFNISTQAGGSITNNISDDKVTRDEYGPSKHLQFTHLNGDGKVSVTTVNGSVTLERK